MTIARRPIASIEQVDGLQGALDGREAALGNPDADGKVLASTTAGVRSWTTPVDQEHRDATKSVHGVVDANGFLSVTGTPASDLPAMSAEFLLDTGWTLGAGWTGDFATGFTHAAGGGTAALTQSKAAVNSTKYQIAWTVTGRTAGSFTLSFGGYTSGALSATGNVGPTSSSTEPLVITPTSDFNGTVVVSVKSITGTSTPTLVLKDSTGMVAAEARYIASNNGVAFGTGALRYNTTGTYNNAFGYGALYSNTTGTYNSAFGHYALRYNTTGGSNNAIGYNALSANTTGGSNNALGQDALRANTTGSSNNAFGFTAGRYLADGTTANATATGGCYFGHATRASVDGATNETVIGYNAIGGGSNTVRLGNSSVTNWLPGDTNVCALGNTTTAFKELYLSDGTDEWKVTINTSGVLTTTKV